MESKNGARRGRGRPPEFDRNQAIEQAMILFWEHGYDGVSISDLTQRLGISPPSLYASFGNKEELFEEVLDHYTATRLKYISKSLSEAPTALDAISTILRECANRYARKGHPTGCLIGGAALALGPAQEKVRNMILTRRKLGEKYFELRLADAKTRGELGASADVKVVATTYSAILLGMSQQATGGASQRILRGMAEAAIQLWPILTK